MPSPFQAGGLSTGPSGAAFPFRWEGGFGQVLREPAVPTLTRPTPSAPLPGAGHTREEGGGQCGSAAAQHPRLCGVGAAIQGGRWLSVG